MKCAEVRAMAESYVAGELPVDTNHGIIAHLERCEGCRGEFEARDALRQTLRTAFRRSTDLAPDPRFVARVHEHAAGGQGATRRHGVSVRWLAIAASLGLIALVGWQLRVGQPATADPRAALAALTTHAAGDHRYCALEHALEQPPLSLEEAARRYGAVYGRLREAVAASPTVRAGNVEILSAHWCEFQGRRFVHVVVRRKQHVVSLLLTPVQAAASADAAHIAACPVADGFRVACFDARGHAGFVVSDLSDDENLSLARELAPILQEYLART